MSIGNRLLINVLIFLALAASLYGYFFLRQERHYAEALAVKRTQAFGESMREILQANLVSEDLAPLKKLLNRIAVFEQPLGMRVMLKSGELFYQSKSLKKFPLGEIAGLSERLKEEDSLLEDFSFGGKSYLVSSMPLRSKSGNFLGILQIYDYRSEFAGELRGYHRRVFSALMLFYALTLATIFFAIQKTVNRPIASLMQEVRGSSSDTEPKRRKGHELSWLQQEFRERDTHLHELKHVITQNSREREVLLDQLKRSEKLAAIGKFAAGLAHEMGSPLSVIEGRSEQALRKIHDPDLLRKNLELISDQSKRLSGMIQDVLLFARRRPLRKAPVDLKNLCHQAVELFEGRYGDIQVAIREDSELPRIELDPDQMLQVLSNLLRNAFQAMPTGGRLDLQLEQVSDRGRSLPWLRIGIADTGVGMDEETQSRLFEPFFSKREDGSGTGLGLSIVYGIIQEHGGKVFVQSRPGEGTRFDLYLPMEPEARAQLGFQTEPSPTNTDPKTITYYSEKEHA